MSHVTITYDPVNHSDTQSHAVKHWSDLQYSIMHLAACISRTSQSAYCVSILSYRLCICWRCAV